MIYILAFYMPFTMISATESIARYIEKTDSDSFLLIISTSFIDISPVIKAVAMDIITGVTATLLRAPKKGLLQSRRQ